MQVPPSLDMHTLASIPEQWITAYQLLFRVARVQAGETILLHAGASGVGQVGAHLIINYLVLTMHIWVPGCHSAGHSGWREVHCDVSVG